MTKKIELSDDQIGIVKEALDKQKIDDASQARWLHDPEMKEKFITKVNLNDEVMKKLD
jgi:hypothetical protein